MSTVKQGEKVCSISVIIPILQGDDSWQALLADLVAFPESSEFLFVSNGMAPHDLRDQLTEYGLNSRSNWHCTTRGRAIQMNHGALHAKSEYLLFLHADSRLSHSAVQQLLDTLESHPDTLLYFDLKFRDQSFLLMQLNSWGVYFRSHVLGIPFGDQGFCLPLSLFRELKGFDEEAAYGEDHLLVWAARRQRIRLKCIGAEIETSARKYQEQGWLKVTFRHLWLTVRQALPQFLLLIKDRTRKCRKNKVPSQSS
ncbi:TIGR04283 family arsenosugar biosynthesis glycosyltransferase [Gimesia sp.]|uniref:TIGR04283 family arsenosugar biosynthesis glycosyltransferase n=1 Tax=Gimesia sp. TaxID=2024833 RepID=UPI000C47D13A|nr:TIGR04283 family arsenosugar biosynthesis glycosyltransferase [Gimesia sp.]MAX39013.1 glycosyl transferase family 2 [Gimesia sp.]HAH47633.1 glycosyl transferase family 2 [Planctomycetaceae bacterium]HBL46655.1 glycosyl transferase family 2 [Planctomycetaceae bacterium]|tara:strand:- start:30305 stop:31066 length:762 start_codon:yes stop_codon:yes gene_type:complete